MADTPTSDNTIEIRPSRLDRLRSMRAAEWRVVVMKGFKAVGWRIYRLVGEAFAVVIALGIVALYLVSGLGARQSLDVSALRPNLAHWFSQSFDGARADMGEVDVRWLPATDDLQFTAKDVIVFAEDGTVLQRLPLLRASMSGTMAMSRQPRLREVEIVGGEVTWLERADGSLIAGLGQPDTVGAFGPVFRGRSETPPRGGAEWLDGFTRLSLTDSRAYVVNESNGLQLSFDVKSLVGAVDGNSVQLDLSGQIKADGDEANTGDIDVAVKSDDRLQSMQLALDLANIRPRALAPPDGRFAVLSAADVPMTGSLSAVYDRTDGLDAAAIDMTVGAGTLDLAGVSRQINGLVMKASLAPGDEAMSIAAFNVDAERLAFESSGELRQLGRLYDGDVGTSPKFDLDVRRAVVDATPLLAAPLDVATAKAVGQIDVDARQLTLDSLSANFGDFGLNLSGEVATRDEGLRSVVVSGQTMAQISPDQLLSLWPVKAADGARRWIDTAVQQGIIDDLSFDLNLGPDFFDEPALTSERVQIDFGVSQGTVQFIRTMSPIIEAVGRGRIDGNALNFELSAGRIDGVTLSDGSVSIPKLTPKGGDIIIDANAVAPVTALMRVINQPPFSYMDKYGVSADGFGGMGEVTLQVRRPLLEFFDQNRITYQIDGAFTDASAPFKLGEHQLHSADVTIQGGKDGLFVSGPANIGPWRAQFDWAERYGQNGEPTRYTVEGIMDRKTLDGFGFGLRDMIGGQALVSVNAEGAGINVQNARISVDMSETELSFGDIWAKGIGEPGQFAASLERVDTGIRLENITLQAPGLDMKGALALRESLALERAEFNRVVIDGLIDGRVKIGRDSSDTRLAVQAAGATLDISDFVRDALDNRGGGSSVALSLDAAFDTLRLAPEYDLSGATLSYRHDGVAAQTAYLGGQRPDGSLSVSLEETDEGRVAELVVPDVSIAAEQFLGLTATRGGALSISATLPKSGEPGATFGAAQVTDFTVDNAPFLAQILSLASLTGLVDTLSGDGLGFDALDFDFALRERTLSLRDAKLYGPAIGMTGEGEIDLAAQTIDVNGTLVPAYSANSLLGDIPLIGDVFVGKDGEGVFALTYDIMGPYSGAQITINPLSALTPGFLRGIFRKDREDLPEEMAAQIEAVRPE